MERTISQQVAHALGYPSTFFGFTPDERGYWHEPGLPWLTPEVWQHPPLGRLGHALTWCIRQVGGNNMAPRFPRDCWVNLAPVGAKKHLVVGKVYVYCYTDPETGEPAAQMGRLEGIDSQCLWARTDRNNHVGLCWVLRSDPGQEVWDVYEVTHYVTYPAL